MSNVTLNGVSTEVHIIISGQAQLGLEAHRECTNLRFTL